MSDKYGSDERFILSNRKAEVNSVLKFMTLNSLLDKVFYIEICNSLSFHAVRIHLLDLTMLIWKLYILSV